MVLPFVAQPEDQGGYGLVMPHTYLYWQNALAFVSYVRGHSLLPAVVARPFERWCVAVGFVPKYLFLLQLGRVRWAHMPYLAVKAKSFSKARQGLPVIMPEDFSVDSVPAWHNALFVDEHGYSYFSPSFAGQFHGSHRISSMILCPMVSFCHLSFALYMGVRRGFLLMRATCGVSSTPLSACGPRERRYPFYTVINMWSGCFSAAMLRYLNQQTLVERRQSAETWKALHSAPMTLILRDFVKESLWLKLKTMEGLHPRVREPMLCPICAVKETHEHVLSQCKYLCLVAKIVSQFFADVTVRDVLYTPFGLLAASPVILLQSSLSVVFWAARWASWRLRCLVRVRRGGVQPHAMWSYFIGYWPYMLGVVSSMHEDWFGCHITELLHALESLNDSGTLKHSEF